MDYLGQITEQNIVMQRGDSKSFTVILKDSNGTQIDIESGDSIFFTAKLDRSQETPDIEKEVNAFTDGTAIVYLTPSDTNDLDPLTYYYDIQWNTGTDKYTVIRGKLKIEEDVTRE